jgi:uncharacterized membrane protein
MPEITVLGWFHTAMGIIAILAAVYTFVKHREILLTTRSGQLYLVTTLITAATALMIFQHGGFGPAHALAVMTLLALGVGTVAATTRIFGRLSRYIQATSFTATLLFHGVPAVTDALMRLPVGDPVLTSIEDPILKRCYLVLFALFLIGTALQLVRIYRQRS